MNELDAQRIESALQLAIRFHRGQRDKAGQPYVTHVLTLMLQASDPVVQQAALLHDLLEDTDATRDTLVAAAIDPKAIEAIELLTHDPKDTYTEYVVRLKRNDVARQVKLLDLNDNYRLSRVAYRTDRLIEDGKRIQRYILTKQFLSDEIPESAYRDSMQPLES
jgi:hypothetical protein